MGRFTELSDAVRWGLKSIRNLHSKINIRDAKTVVTTMLPENKLHFAYTQILPVCQSPEHNKSRNTQQYQYIHAVLVQSSVKQCV